MLCYILSFAKRILWSTLAAVYGLLHVYSSLSRMDMGDLCEVYEDQESGASKCMQLVEDKRCVGTGKPIDLLDTVLAALDPFHESHEQEKETICQCACWSEIAQVFSEMGSVVS